MCTIQHEVQWLLHGSHAGHMIASWEGRWGPWHWSSELPAPPTPAPGVSVKSQGIKSNAFIHVSCTAGWSFTIWASREDPSKHRTQKHIRSTTFKVLILEFGKMHLSKLERIPFQGQHDGMWIVLTCRWPRKHSTLIKKKKIYLCVLQIAAAAKSLQSCPTLCDPIHGSPPGYAIPGILQARTLEWGVADYSGTKPAGSPLQTLKWTGPKGITMWIGLLCPSSALPNLLLS